MEEKGGLGGAKYAKIRTISPPSRSTVSASISLLFVILSLRAAHASLESYHPVEFLNEEAETQFTHFDVDQRTGSIYIGGKSYLYHLNQDLTLYQKESIVPDSDVCGRQCENYNRILAVAPSPVDRLVTCESFSGKCQLRNLTNISSAEMSQQEIINPLTPAVGVLGPESKLYAGVSPQYDPKSPTAYVTEWNVQPSSSTPFAEQLSVNSPSSDAAQQEFQLNFIRGFNYSGYTYYVTNQQQLIYQRGSADPVADHPYVSKINRVCQTSVIDGFEGFTEVGLQCGDVEYNLVQSIDISSRGGSFDKDSMFALFSKGAGTSNVATQDSVLCVYSKSAIEDKFVDTVYNCLTGGSTYGVKHLDSSCATLNVSISDKTWRKKLKEHAVNTRWTLLNKIGSIL